MKVTNTNTKKQSTRDTILQALKSIPHATVEKLAEIAEVSPITIRHHLNSLQGEGLLLTTTVRRKIGRPHYVYSLSEAGHELFPKKYVRLSSRLINGLKERFSSKIVSDLLIDIVDKIVTENTQEFSTLTFEKRLDYLIQLLAEEGFLARWEETDSGEYKLIESSCPYISVGQTHHEVCIFDKRLITSILDVRLKQDSCMLDGDTCCQFTLMPANIIPTANN